MIYTNTLFTIFTDVVFSVNEVDTVGFFEILPLPSGSTVVVAVNTINFDCSTNTLTIVTRTYGSQTIIPGVLDLGNIGFSLTVTLTDAESLVVTFGGQWSIGQVTIDVGVVYTRQFDITATPSGTRFDLAALASGFTGLTLPNPFGGSISFDSFVLSGVIASDGTTTLIISQTLQVTKVYLIYHKPSDGTSQRALTLHLSSLKQLVSMSLLFHTLEVSLLQQ